MAQSKPTLSEQIAALRSEISKVTADLHLFREEAKEWMDSADALIERNRCLDVSLQDAIIKMGEDKLFRIELAKRTSQWRQRLNTISGAVLGFLAGAAALWGYVEYWVQ